MKGEKGALVRRKEAVGSALICGGGENGGGGILEPKSKLLEGSSQLVGSVGSGPDFGRGGEKIFYSGPTQTTREELIRVVEVADDLLETGKIPAKFRVERGTGMKEASQGAVFNAAGGLGIEALLGQGHDLAIAENLDGSRREMVPEEPNGG